MGAVDWFCRTLCKRVIEREAERVRAEQEEEIAIMKTEVARRADPDKLARAAWRKLEKLTGAGVVLACFFGCAGGQIDPRAQRAAGVFECYVAAVAPYVGEALDVAELVREAVHGRASVPQALALLGASADDLRAVDAALAACRGGPVAPLANPRTLAFREPPSDL